MLVGIVKVDCCQLSEGGLAGHADAPRCCCSLPCRHQPPAQVWDSGAAGGGGGWDGPWGVAGRKLSGHACAAGWAPGVCASLPCWRLLRLHARVLTTPLSITSRRLAFPGAPCACRPSLFPSTAAKTMSSGASWWPRGSWHPWWVPPPAPGTAGVPARGAGQGCQPGVRARCRSMPGLCGRPSRLRITNPYHAPPPAGPRHATHAVAGQQRASLRDNCAATGD